MLKPIQINKSKQIQRIIVPMNSLGGQSYSQGPVWKMLVKSRLNNESNALPNEFQGFIKKLG
jgi:hypothetical protein